jgi:small-conductance mechanosensitive channel
MKKDKEVNKLSFQNNLGNYLFVACMFAGIALGMIFGSVSAGTLLGMAFGFAAYGIVLVKQKRQP